MTDFCRQVRRHNPGARILWAYGLCGQSAAETIREAVSAYRAESGDFNCDFLLLITAPASIPALPPTSGPPNFLHPNSADNRIPCRQGKILRHVFAQKEWRSKCHATSHKRSYSICLMLSGWFIIQYKK